jgi:hypothetical protein
MVAGDAVEVESGNHGTSRSSGDAITDDRDGTGPGAGARGLP